MVAFGNREGARVVLVVERDQDLASALQTFLQDAGYVVLVEADIAGALRVLEYMRPHVILFDRRAPGLDLAAFAQTLKANETLIGIPRLLMTAVDVRREEAAFVDAVLPKPFDTDRLLEVIERHARASQGHEAPALSPAQT